MRTASLLLVLSSAACTAPRDPAPVVDPAAPPAEAPAEPIPEAEFQYVTSPKGAFTAGWRPVGGAIPVNELFELEVVLFEGRAREKPLVGATINASAWMPEHMHGMSRRPRTQETAPGRYLVRGMMLHMEGFWQLFLDVTAGAIAERVEFEIHLR
jgi:hypothetical protein